MGKSRSDLDTIENRLTQLDPVRAGQVVYTLDPQVMLAAVREAPDAFVVSSWIIDYRFNAITSAIEANEISRRKVTFLAFGEIPPRRNPFLDGVIPVRVPGDYDLLVKILAGVNPETTLAMIKAKFPAIAHC